MVVAMPNGTKHEGYQHLLVWRKAMDLAEQVYAAVKRFPNHERFALAAQMCRAVVSIPSNLAERYGRGSLGDYRRHVGIANGSLLELETQIHLAKRIGYFEKADADTLIRRTEEVGRMLAGLRKALTLRATKASRNSPDA